MKNLILTLLATSSVDSLNPIGITQQFILQGMIKKPRHIWYFIITTAIVNMIFGYFVYYGIMSFINHGYNYFIDNFGLYIYICELILGLVILFLGFRIIIKNYKYKKKFNENERNEIEEQKIKSKIKSVAPIALIGIGVVATASELTSAVPYFTFLAVLLNYKLSFFILTIILIFYNIIYILPFVILFIIYLISKEKFNKIYNFFKKYFKKFSNVLIPLLVFAIAIFVIFNSISNLVCII